MRSDSSLKTPSTASLQNLPYHTLPTTEAFHYTSGEPDARGFVNISKSNGLALLTNKIYVLGSLVSFPVATVISWDPPSPGTAVYYISMLLQLFFFIFSFLSLPGIEPSTYILLVIGQTIRL